MSTKENINNTISRDEILKDIKGNAAVILYYEKCIGYKGNT